MIAPNTYSDWANLLDKFGEGDDSVLQLMESGTFVLDAGTSLRFCSKVNEAYKSRKQSWLNKFQRSMDIHNFKSADDYCIVIRNAKANLIPLTKFVNCKGMPTDIKITLQKDLDDFVFEIRKSLKNSISKFSKEREKILMIISTFGLYENTEIVNTNSINSVPYIKQDSNGRKIIF